MTKADGFDHFSPSAIQFLVELSHNNDRDWFKAHQARYEADVREPTRAFVRAMAPRLERLSPHLVASDKKVGGAMMRPQRDTRFSPDKTPYKTNVGVHFRHAAGKDVHAPGLYVHLDPGEVFLGAGIWHPDAGTLSRIRKHMDDNRAAFKRARGAKAFQALFSPGGDSLKRPPKGYAADHPLIEDLKRKDHIAVSSVPMATLFKPGFVREVERRFKAARGYMAFLCQALDLPF